MDAPEAVSQPEGTVVERVLVPFDGEGSGVAPLTWSQVGIWGSIVQSGESRTVRHVAELPPGTSVGTVADTLRFMMSRHQSLRTRLLFEGAGDPLQTCATSGEATLEVVDAGGADPAAVAEAVSDRYQRTLFDYATEWPVRLAAIRRQGVLTHWVLVILHTSIDAYGLTNLLADIAARDPRTGQAPPVTAVQPLDEARRQATPAGLRTNAASLRYLERVLRSVPASRFGAPKRGGAPSYRMVQYHSPATLLALRAAAARCRTGTSPVLLASFAVALARLTGINPVMAMVMVSNRFRPGLADAVSKTTQISPYLIDVADLSLAEAIGLASQSAMNAYKHAYYDPYQQDEVVERVERERGEQIDVSCFYNDRRQQDRVQTAQPVPTRDQILAAVPLGELVWKDEPGMPLRKLYFNVDDPPDAVAFKMSVDTRYFTQPDMAAMVRGVEAVAVEAALDPTTPTRVYGRYLAGQDRTGAPR